MRPQNSLTRELRIEEHDDGSTRGIVFVAVEGLPGLYPEEPSLAGIAEFAGKRMLALQKEHGGSVPEEAIKEEVAKINDEKRITNVEAAWQAARYEDVIRMALPAARDILQGARKPYEAFVARNLPSTSTIIDLLIYLQTSGDVEAIRDQYVEALEPKQRATFTELKVTYQQAEAQLTSMVSNLHERSDQAVIDYYNGEDHTEEAQQEDRHTYAKYLP